jgi:hypothetical protein
MKCKHGILGKYEPLDKPDVYLFFGNGAVEQKYSTVHLKVSAVFVVLSEGIPSSAIYAGFDLVGFGKN